MKTITRTRLFALLQPDRMTLKEVADDILQDYTTHRGSNGKEASDQNTAKTVRKRNTALSCCTDNLQDYVPFSTNGEHSHITITSPVMSLSDYTDLMHDTDQSFANGTVSPLGLLLDEREGEEYYVCNATECNPYKVESRYETENMHNLPFQENMKEFCLKFGPLQSCATCRRAQNTMCCMYDDGSVCKGFEAIVLAILKGTFLPLLSLGGTDIDEAKCAVLTKLRACTYALRLQSIEVLR